METKMDGESKGKESATEENPNNRKQTRREPQIIVALLRDRQKGFREAEACGRRQRKEKQGEKRESQIAPE